MFSVKKDSPEEQLPLLERCNVIVCGTKAVNIRKYDGNMLCYRGFLGEGKRSNMLNHNVFFLVPNNLSLMSVSTMRIMSLLGTFDACRGVSLFLFV